MCVSGVWGRINEIPHNLINIQTSLIYVIMFVHVHIPVELCVKFRDAFYGECPDTWEVTFTDEGGLEEHLRE